VDWREKGKAAGLFVLKNLDALFVIAVAGVVLYLEATGKPERDLVDSALLALVGVIAIALLRDRHSRARLDEVASFVQDLQSDRPYQVRSETNSWEIRGRGEAATYTKVQDLIFTRNEVCTMEHWSTGTGSVDACHADWRLKSKDPWIGAPTIHDFGINNGRNYIFSLDMERSRGDHLQWRVRRELRNSFSDSRESVSLKLQAPTHRPRMQVIWPKDREPKLVELRCDGGPTRELKAERRSDGRLWVDEQLAAGAANSSARIEWTW
jgi:hypothetical protein